MRKAWQDVLEVFFYALGLARQVHDQGLAAQHTGGTAQHPARCDGKAMVPHGSAMPGALRSATLKVTSGVISRGAKPVPPVVRIRFTSAGIRKAQQLGFELGGIVRQKQRFLHLVACGGEHFHNERAAFVLPFAAAALIGKGDHRRAQGRSAGVGSSFISSPVWMVPPFTTRANTPPAA